MTWYKIIVLINWLEDDKQKTVKMKNIQKKVIQKKYEIKVLPLKYLLHETKCTQWESIDLEHKKKSLRIETQALIIIHIQDTPTEYYIIEVITR